MSIASKWVLDILKAEFPEIYGGGYNCRPINNNPADGYSQHSWPNALDLTNVEYGYSTHPENQAYLDTVASFLLDNAHNLSIKMILWRGKSLFTGNPVAGHQNHIHVDFWPTGAPLPPCAGGSLRYQFSNGRTVYGDPGPENGMTEVNDPRPTSPPATTPSFEMPKLELWDGYKSHDRAFLGDAVAMLQVGLAWKGFADKMTANRSCAADGWFGYGTDEAVRAFQRNNGLFVDGVAGANTWAKLAEIKTLRKGDGLGDGNQMIEVAIMQMGLARKGHIDTNSNDAVCAADGKFGDGTEAALKAFQRQCGLVVDGVCGRLSWSAISAK